MRSRIRALSDLEYLSMSLTVAQSDVGFGLEYSHTDTRLQIAHDRDAANEILTRADGDLTGPDADEFDRLMQRAQANKERLDGYQRRADAVASFEAITSAAPDPAAPNHPQHGALHGQEFLTVLTR
ncbi:hypothetical protein MAHJHV54_26360 [Mycobacterium avium subsp. hominissuis]|nr:hypothetical protein L838_1823 [Mycobacterium avium MAV_120709_2344]QNR38729.1 hypothetical protein BJP76_20350 [Mycobacterium avium subsp. hominissuis]